jgi:hypothetical protein
MAIGSKPAWLRVPRKRDVRGFRLRAQLDEQLAVLRVLHARLRKRGARVTIRMLEALEQGQERLELERRSAAERLDRVRQKASRILSRSDGA